MLSEIMYDLVLKDYFDSNKTLKRPDMQKRIFKFGKKYYCKKICFGNNENTEKESQIADGLESNSTCRLLC